MARSALAGRFGTGLDHPATEGLAAGLEGLPFIHPGGDAPAHLGIELGHRHRPGKIAVAIVFTLLALELLEACLHPAVQGLGPLLPPGMINPIEAVEGLPPAGLTHKPRGALPLQPVAVPVQSQLIPNRGAIGAVLLAHRGQGGQGRIEITVAEAGQVHSVQGRLPVIEALPISPATGGGIEQLPLQAEGRGPTPLPPQLGGLLTPAAALIERCTAGKPAERIELIAVAEANIKLAAGSGLSHPGRQLPLPPVHEADPGGNRSQGDRQPDEG